MLHEQYLQPEWMREYTDGSKIQDSTKAGIYSKFFTQCASMGYLIQNFHAEIFAISLLLESIKKNTTCFSKAVILIDSKAAVVINHQTETQIISLISQTLTFFINATKQSFFNGSLHMWELMVMKSQIHWRRKKTLQIH